MRVRSTWLRLMLLRLSPLLLLLLLPAPSRCQTAYVSQTAQQGISWYVLNSTLRFHDRFSLYLELQPRLFHLPTQMMQVQARGAVSYHPHKDVQLSLGYVYTETWPYGQFPFPGQFPEHRIWEQVQLSQTVSRLIFQLRLRLEQRFIGHFERAEDDSVFLDGFDYANRVRAQLRMVVPLNHDRLIGRTVYLYLHDELFVNFGSVLVRANLFDQNRASLGLGLQVTDDLAVQAGYMNQFIEKSDGLRFESNHGLLLMVTYNPDMRPLLRRGRTP